MPVMTGMKAAKAMTASNRLSKTPMIRETNTPPIQVANSQGKRALAFSQGDFNSSSRSFPDSRHLEEVLRGLFPDDIYHVVYGDDSQQAVFPIHHRHS